MAAALGLGVTALATPALAGQEVYVYGVVHPTYGDIGTFTATIHRGADAMRIDSRLRVAVTLLGLVVFRQNTDITEVMRGDRLVSLQSVTEKDGRRFEVHGEAQGERFVVNATAGSFAGPATVAPSDPWVLKRTGEVTMVFTDTGRIVPTHISGGDYEAVGVNGAVVSARHFVVMGLKRQDVWLDDRGVPVRFRSVDYGAPIDFVLQNEAAGVATVAALNRPALAGPANGDKEATAR
jgi:hypothetical protein